MYPSAKSCFPKDLVEVNNFYDHDKLNLPLISRIISSNEEHLHWTVNQLLSLKQNNSLKRIVLVGAAFKEDTDDLRNSPTLDIYNKLNEMGEGVLILETEIEVPQYESVKQLEEVPPNSLLSIMYPLKEELNMKISNYAKENDCIIYYPWS